MREVRQLKRKRQTCLKAFCVLIFFALLTAFLPARVGSADKQSPVAAVFAARGLAKSIAQTSTTFAAEPIKAAQSSKPLLTKQNLVRQSVQITASASIGSTAAPIASAASTSLAVSSSSVSAVSSSFVPAAAVSVSRRSPLVSSISSSQASLVSRPSASQPVQKSLPITAPAASQQSSSAPLNDINWLIQRESSGNPNAENGQHKGIGQLSESIYEKYLNRSWEQVKGNYGLQLQAMQAYIQERYGSVAKAISFWQQNGWY